ncbi:MAG TPA: RsmG family class I SAM-dependent methyltransferase [Acidimicrobiales bacterium]|nr:RsmG family class I SAM-dependent methyltransferase [Acidimicrobiales bacterium]
MSGPVLLPDGDSAPASLLDVLRSARLRGLLGDRPVEDQVEHAVGFVRAYSWAAPGPPRPAIGDDGDRTGSGVGPRPSCWLDLGSGGGIPGLVLAACWPESQGLLVEASQRRARFLEEAVQTLDWGRRVRVVPLRAEAAVGEEGLRAGVDLVVARSFGPPPVTAECASPFLVPGSGLLVVSEPPTSSSPAPGSEPEVSGDPVRWPPAGLATLGLVPVGVARHDYGYQVLRQATACPGRFPRRPGMAAKRPLWSLRPDKSHH